MGTDFLIFAIVMAALAVGLVIYALVAEFGEAWEISHQGWSRGHRVHHLLRGHR